MGRNEPLLDHGNSQQQLSGKRIAWTITTMVMTFLIYASFHMTRKIPSVVSTVINPVKNKTSVYGVNTTLSNGRVCSNEGWEPFNDAMNPISINSQDHGIKVSNSSEAWVDGTYSANKDIAYSSYQIKDNSSLTAIIYCENIDVSNCYTNNQNKFAGWVVSTTNNCNNVDPLFVANTTSPVPSAVNQLLWTNCTDQSFGYLVVEAIDVTSGTELWGNMITVYLVFYALGLFVNGHIADHMNLKLFVMIGMGGASITVALVGCGYYFNITTSAYYWVIFSIQGLFQATGWPAVVAITGPWLGKGKRGLAMGIWNAHTSVGNIMGNTIGAAGLVMSSGSLNCDNNWPMAFVLAGIVMMGINIITLVVLRSHPNSVGLEQLDGSSDDTDEVDELVMPVSDNRNAQEKRSTFLRALCIPGLLEFAMCLFFCKMVAYTFIYWGPTYVYKTTSLNQVDATKYSSFLDYGGIIGGIGAGFLADRLKSQAWVAFGCLLCGIVALYVFRSLTTNIDADHLTEYKLLMMMVGIFINAPYALITTAVSADLGTTTKGDAALMATVTGIIDGTGSIGAAIQGSLIGYISTAYGWETVFYVLMAFLGVSALTLLRLVFRDSKRLCCKNQ
jgi:OPA family glycerol-3-phosphate transporter-like MFS transporter 1/2